MTPLMPAISVELNLLRPLMICPHARFQLSDETIPYVLPVWQQSISKAAGTVGDRNAVPFMHLTLAFLGSLSYVPGALIYLEGWVSREKMAEGFPRQQSGTGRELPEEFVMQGLIFGPILFPLPTSLRGW